MAIDLDPGQSDLALDVAPRASAAAPICKSFPVWLVASPDGLWARQLASHACSEEVESALESGPYDTTWVVALMWVTATLHSCREILPRQQQ